MKLLNCSSFAIEEFFGSRVPQTYVVLSHRWEDSEATYQDLTNGNIDWEKPGWAKIREACRLAREQGQQYIWVDTCCINKQDSSELAEAINSMFKWYARSTVCYAYLSDVEAGEPIEESLWFTRGWTLQELIAPPEVMFFDRNWQPLNTRAQLCDVIHRRTGIDTRILLHDASAGKSIETLLSEISLAQRMSWASGRTTTREEDRAYSLLGIFGVHMPMLYGEGKDAFIRLQEKIIEGTNDMSLFAWVSSSRNMRYSGILAVSPEDFRKSSNVVLSRDTKYNPEYRMTNKGLKINTETIVSDESTLYIGLGCHRADDASQKILAIQIKSQGGDVFLRSEPDTFGKLSNAILEGKAKHVFYVKKALNEENAVRIVDQMSSVLRGAFQIRDRNLPTNVLRFAPSHSWNERQRMFITEGRKDFKGFVLLQFTTTPSQPFIVACGYDSAGKQWACVATLDNVKTRDIYTAAVVEGDLDKMQVLGVEASKRGKKAASIQVTGPGKVIIWSSVREDLKEPIFDIWVEFN